MDQITVALSHPHTLFFELVVFPIILLALKAILISILSVLLSLAQMQTPTRQMFLFANQKDK